MCSQNILKYKYALRSGLNWREDWRPNHLFMTYIKLSKEVGSFTSSGGEFHMLYSEGSDTFISISRCVTIWNL